MQNVDNAMTVRLSRSLDRPNTEMIWEDDCLSVTATKPNCLCLLLFLHSFYYSSNSTVKIAEKLGWDANRDETCT